MGPAETGKRRRAENADAPGLGGRTGGYLSLTRVWGWGFCWGTLALGKSLPPASRSRVPGSQLPTSRKVR
jgi:hypothetical protein